MNCEKIQELLSSLVDGELPGVERRQILRHLCFCAECRKELESLLELDSQLSELNDKLNSMSMSEDFTEKVMGKIPSSGKESVLFFLKDLQQSDTSVLDSVKSKGAEGIMEHARSKNINFSMDDFKKILLEINGMSDDVELSEEELSEVVGGIDHTMDLKTLSQSLLDICEKQED